MKRDTMYAISPLDGRYAKVGENLAPYFSEYALVKNRVKVEVEWLCFIIENVNYDKLNKFKKKETLQAIKSISSDFNEKDFNRIKEIESVTNHDVKAVEYFVDEKLEGLNLSELKSFVHIGCTSEDINNTAEATMIKEGLYSVWIPTANKLIDAISKIAKEHAKTPMLAHTHGQPATPTTVGKEMAVYEHRLCKSLENIESINIQAKFNGATGTYGAISTAFPQENWPELCEKFIEQHMGFEFNPLTTQIESHDYICHILDGIRHFNNVLLDFDLDMWTYISMEYFKQIAVETEVGSSVMPHKVNPIRFENSEANIDMSNAICMALSNKLPKSRMQRDLSDSSSKRNIGLAFGYSLQAIQQTIGGLNKVEINKEKLTSDLENRWEVLAEPIQTMLRKYGMPDAYDQLKKLTRGKGISKEAIQEFVESLDILSDEDKNKLLELTPSTYIGLAEKEQDILGTRHKIARNNVVKSHIKYKLN